MGFQSGSGEDALVARTFLVYALFVWLTLAGLTYLRTYNLRVGSTAQTHVPILEFTGKGAITYFREGDGHINPYLVYRQADGSVATKILSFKPARSAASVAAAFGAGPIAATGIINNEELVVKSARPVAGLVPGIAVLTIPSVASATAFGRTFTPVRVIPSGLELTLASASSTEHLLLTPGALIDSHDALFLSWANGLGRDGAFIIIAVQKKP